GYFGEIDLAIHLTVSYIYLRRTAHDGKRGIWYGADYISECFHQQRPALSFPILSYKNNILVMVFRIVVMIRRSSVASHVCHCDLLRFDAILRYERVTDITTHYKYTGSIQKSFSFKLHIRLRS